MDLDLKDKNVLITGSSRGIGLAIANGFAGQGARVVVTGRDQASVSHAVEQIERSHGKDRAHGFAGNLDVQDVIQACVQSMVKLWGGIDILIANLGSGTGERGWDTGEEEWNRLLGINLLSGVKAAQVAIPHLKKSAGSSIVFISSIAGIENLGAPPAYEVGKAGVIAYSKYLARELASDSIRVNAVAPGNIIFPGSTWEDKVNKDKGKILALIEREVPMNRFGCPEEVADAVLFLASKRASFITGACLVVDGGQTKSF